MIDRKLKATILQNLTQNKIFTIFGARGSGKTTLLKLIIQDLKKQGKKTLYFNLDKDKNNPIFKNDLEFSLFLKKTIFKKDKTLLYLFLDEAQLIKKPDIFLKNIFTYFKQNIKLIISSSVAWHKLQDQDILQNERLSFFLEPISFLEFVQFKTNHSIPEYYLNNFELLDSFHEIYGLKIQKLFLDFLSYKFQEQNKQLRYSLSFYKQLKNDVQKFTNIENMEGFKNLLHLLNNKTAHLVNKSELSNILDLHFETTQKYLNILEATFLVNYVPPFFGILKKELTKMPKVYPYELPNKNPLFWDKNLSNYKFLDPTLIQNYIYLALKNTYGQDNLYYYQTLSKAKLDFVLLLLNKVVPIEIQFFSKINKKFNPSLKIFNKNYNHSILLNLYYTQQYCKYEPQHNILFLPIYLAEFYNLKNLFQKNV